MGSEKSYESIPRYHLRSLKLKTSVQNNGESSKRMLRSQTRSQEASLHSSCVLGNQKTKERNNPIKEQPAKRKRESGKCSERLSSCGICLDKKTEADMFKSKNCSHPYCLVCIGKHVAAKIRENIIKVRCPSVTCNGLLEPQDCRSIVPQEVLDRWEVALCESLLGSKKIYCPFKDCSALLVVDDGEKAGTSAECPHCHRLFCVQCKVPWHAGFDCKSYKGENMDKKFIDLAETEKWQKCPSCKFYVQRTHGCESIVCRCGYKFCYICGNGWVFGHLCLTGGTNTSLIN